MSKDVRRYGLQLSEAEIVELNLRNQASYWAYFELQRVDFAPRLSALEAIASRASTRLQELETHLNEVLRALADDYLLQDAAGQLRTDEIARASMIAGDRIRAAKSYLTFYIADTPEHREYLTY